ncbi:MAG: choice-of-anchor B family protein [Candidatus Eisenbacteria bacterium]|uniref:Choice-of-anchor B family protein n=1 Tax=Eiseniibacteriota bacterium TaxID=2212470 RepID=A0A956M228_UNCEI|nr:choice-of-anchor B family protein [Candidatus Eisenbacteria bacterium]
MHQIEGKTRRNGGKTRSGAVRASLRRVIRTRTVAATIGAAGAAAVVVGVPAAHARDVALLSNVSPRQISGGSREANDVTGFVSSGGIEYAILGVERGFAFFDLGDPEAPREVAVLPAPASIWGDAATFGDYAYLVKDYPPGVIGEGLAMADLSRIDEGIVELTGHLTAEGMTRAHNVRVNPASGTLYVCGANNHGLTMFDLGDPAHPVLTGFWNDAYVHDAFLASYPQSDGSFREIGYLACGGQGLAIVDLTDPAAPVTLSRYFYDGLAYCHQVWVDPEGRYAYVGDEIDEIANPGVFGPTTYVMDVTDPSHPQIVRLLQGEVESIDHNMWGRWGYLFQANYTSGLQIWDIRDPADPREAGSYDTFPENDSRGFHGAWGVYPDLPSGIVLVSDIESGLFVFDCSPATGIPIVPFDPAALSYGARVYPNPVLAGAQIRYRLPRSAPVRLRILDASGRSVTTLVDGEVGEGWRQVEWDPSGLPSGVYFARLESVLGARSARMVVVR